MAFFGDEYEPHYTMHSGKFSLGKVVTFFLNEAYFLCFLAFHEGFVFLVAAFKMLRSQIIQFLVANVKLFEHQRISCFYIFVICMLLLWDRFQNLMLPKYL